MRRHTTHYIAGSAKVKDNLVAGHGLVPDEIDVVDAFFSPSVPRDRLDRKAALRTELGLPEDGLVVLGCGYIEWRKGADLFMDVARRVRKLARRPVHFFWIGGISPETDHSRRLISLDDPECPVSFLGNKDNFKDYLIAADAYLLTSREDYSSLASLEACECSTPVICFRNVGILAGFITPDIGSVVDFEDTQAMAGALLDLLADPDRLKTMGQAARRKALSTYVVDNLAPLLLSKVLRAANCAR
jgi:glycosyltransferase involved in cell wall biosynthesis